MKKIFSFILNDQIFQYYLDFDQLTQFPKNIRDQLFFEEKYCIKSLVDKNVFQTFMNYEIEKREIPNINAENLSQFLLLNEEFNPTVYYTSKHELSDVIKISILEMQLPCDGFEKSFCETFISENLDYFIENYSDKLYDIPITSLCNIFYNRRRNLINHDKAYHFINNCNNDNIRNNLFVLISSLDASKLSKESFKNSIQNKETHFGFTPKIDISYMDSLDRKISDIQYNCENSFEKLIQQVQKQDEMLNIMHRLILFTNIDKKNINQFLFYVSNQICANFQKQINSGVITSIQLPTNVYCIPAKIFQNCTLLKTIEFPSNLYLIDNHAFEGCTSLTDIILPSLLFIIGTNAFSGCTSLAHVKINSKIFTIGCYAFHKCSSLKKIELPPQIYVIGHDCFSKCSSLTEVIIPFSICEIPSCAFAECTSLKQINIPSSIHIIDDSAFAECSSLEYVSIPSSVNSIGKNAFLNCLALKPIIFPHSIKTIGSHAFYGCQSLSYICIHSSFITVTKDIFPSETEIRYVNNE